MTADVRESHSKLVNEMKSVFELQKVHQFAVRRTTYRERIKKLDRLMKLILSRKQEIRDAIFKDLRKPQEEVDLTEIYTITSEIKHARRHLHEWMKPHSVPTPLAFIGATSKIIYEPKGVALIISPWNFPLQLTFGPLISAIAAGNCIMIKPSENTPNTSALIHRLVSKLFDEKEVAVFNGGVEVASELLCLPFDHIFFTGSPQVGKIVMKAAAKNLCSVTLELGGRSPTIVDRSANIQKAAQRIVQGKFINSGQICIAPDHVLVHEDIEQEFIQALKNRLNKAYGKDAQRSRSYGRMVNLDHFNRAETLLEEAIQNGATIEHGGRVERSDLYIEPTVLSNVPKNCRIINEEIFAPILPIVSYSEIKDVCSSINSDEKPLALYIYSQSAKVNKEIIQETRAGGTCININGIQFFNNNLPFGGVNSSGIGKSHGWFGFDSFSNARAILKQELPGPVDLLAPSYNNWKRKLIAVTLKWF